jgi:hypothetical protein
MVRVLCFILAGLTVVAFSNPSLAQGKQVPTIVSASASQTSLEYAASFPPVKNPASVDQIRDYMRFSGESEKYRARLINSVDKLRYIGKPYWPESFWTSIKQEMQNADLTPMYVVLFQHGVSRDLMQDVLDSYQRLGAAHFAGSPACFKLGGAVSAMQADTAQIMQDETQKLIEKVYQVYKPQIKAARAKYMIDHPDWKDN